MVNVKGRECDAKESKRITLICLKNNQLENIVLQSNKSDPDEYFFPSPSSSSFSPKLRESTLIQIVVSPFFIVQRIYNCISAFCVYDTKTTPATHNIHNY